MNSLKWVWAMNLPCFRKDFETHMLRFRTRYWFRSLGKTFSSKGIKILSGPVSRFLCRIYFQQDLTLARRRNVLSLPTEQIDVTWNKLFCSRTQSIFRSNNCKGNLRIRSPTHWPPWHTPLPFSFKYKCITIRQLWRWIFRRLITRMTSTYNFCAFGWMFYRCLSPWYNI